ncbi:hypothetical protein [Streptomyces sp. NPDC055709]
MMKISNHSYYVRRTQGEKPFYFEDYNAEYRYSDQKDSIRQDVEAFLKVTPVSIRHFSDGVGPTRDKPPFNQLLSNYVLSTRGLSGGATFFADWYKMGNQNFIFCCLCVGDELTYNYLPVMERKWYAEIDPTSIQDCWVSCDLLEVFEHIEDAAGAHFMINQKLTKPTYFTGEERPPLLVRANGSDVISMAVQYLIIEIRKRYGQIPIGEIIKKVNARRDLAMGISGNFGYMMELKIAKGALDLGSNPWKANPKGRP